MTRTRRIVRAIGSFLRAILTEGNPGASPAGVERFRQEDGIGFGQGRL